MPTFKDLTGQRFGMWKVINFFGISNKKETLWNCKCECGTERAVDSASLVNNRSKSCGCAWKKIKSGQRYGQLLTIKIISKSSDGQNIWQCICDCGREKNILASNLLRGFSKSCGHTRGKVSGEESIIDKENYCEVLLSKNMVAKIDKIDKEIISKHIWCCRFKNGKPYAYTTIKKHGVGMHRFLLNIYDSNIEVDHKNRDTLDNRRENIRIATRAQNCFNTYRKNKCIYKGVYEVPLKNKIKYTSRLRYSGKSINLNCFNTKEEAGFEYDKCAIVLYKDFAYLNFPERKQEIIDWLQTEEGQKFKIDIETKLSLTDKTNTI